jgi:hypothetical protein
VCALLFAAALRGYKCASITGGPVGARFCYAGKGRDGTGRDADTVDALEEEQRPDVCCDRVSGR